MGGPRSS